MITAMFVLAILVIVDVVSAQAVVDSTTVSLVVSAAAAAAAAAAAKDDNNMSEQLQLMIPTTQPPTLATSISQSSEQPSQFVYLSSSSEIISPTVTPPSILVTTEEEEDATTTTDAGDAAKQQQQQQTTTTHRLGPTDDTYIEIYRPNTPLGDRTKLKLDAIDTKDEDKDEERDDRNEDETKRKKNRMPTKIILLKFDINRVMRQQQQQLLNSDNSNNLTQALMNRNGVTTTTAAALTRVTLNMYALTGSKFGGYVTRLRTNPRGGRRTDDDDDDNEINNSNVNNSNNNEWDEESTTWRDFVNGDNERENAAAAAAAAKKLLPDDDKPRGKWILISSSSLSQNNTNTTATEEEEDEEDDEWIRLPKNPEIGHFNTVTANEWSTMDITNTILYELPQMDDNLAIVYLDNDNNNSSTSGEKYNDKVLSLMLTTDIADGVIYASKEDWSNNGPYLEFTFSTTTTTTTTAAAAADSSTTPSSLMKPVIVDTVNEGTESIAIVNTTTTTTTTSVVSSSFHMTLIAIKNGNIILGTTSRSNTVVGVVPSLEEKEGPSIIKHLLRVYREVLSIPPMDILLVYEDKLVMEDVVLSSNSGVIRKCVFRVMAIFDQSVVKNMTSETVEVLDAATNYAFLGPEELQFIKIYKSIGRPIVTDPADYDVTVLQGDYLAPTMTTIAAADNLNDSSVIMDNADILSTTTPTSNPSWIKPTFIAGASVIAFASMAAALLLWKQRRGDTHVNDGNSRKNPSFGAGDSPRSLDSTTVIPGTPSPTCVFMDRFNMKKKNKFDYAEFEDEDVEDPSIYATDRIDYAIVMNPSTNVECQQFTTNTAVELKPTLNIEYTERGGNASDSSVSDVSAHLLGASRMRNDSGAESLLLDTTVERLLDTTVESYNMEVMSALDQVRFDDVLASSPAVNFNYTTYNARYASDDDNNCSLSTGAVPSEMYSNMSMDYSDTSRVAAYGGHLFALDLLRNKDTSLLELPPPPSDIASDSESQDVGEEDGDAEVIPSCDNELASDMTRGKIEQDAATQDINDEWTKIMKLLNTSNNSEDHSHYIGTVAGHNIESNTAWETYDAANAKYDGLSVLIHDELELVRCKTDTRNSADEEDEEAVKPCDTRNSADEEDESSLVTEQI